MKKKNFKELLVPLLAGVLIVGGLACLSYSYWSNKSAEDETNATINNFMSDIIQNAQIENNTSSEEIPVASPEPEQEITVEKKKPDTIGVMRISKISLEAPIAYGTDNWILKSHIGMYSSLDSIEELGGLAGFSAHSSVTGRCSHCYFDRVEELVEGDEIEIIWNDGNIYKYSVFYVCPNEDKTLNYYYTPVADKTTITLTTCTDGNPDVRTIIRAELISTEKYKN